MNLQLVAQMGGWLVWLLNQPILRNDMLHPLYAVILGIAIFLAYRHGRVWLARLAIGVGVGLMIAAVTLVIGELVLNVGGGPLPVLTRCWVLFLGGSLGLAIANFPKTRWPRRVLAGLFIPLVIVTTTLGINKNFGMNATVAELFGVQMQPPIPLPARAAPSADTPNGPLSRTWKAPAGMPAEGSIGQRKIPGRLSHFRARPAGVYLPPAALVQHAPRLPVVVMMMGQPGNPDPSWVANALNKLAIKHQGLAPIVVVADQIGHPAHDTLCLNTKHYGNVETYINVDVVNWIKANLNVLLDRNSWTIAGYSHGGQCAISMGANYPNIWGNIIDISGEFFPGSDHPITTREDEFHGNQAAYDAVMPMNILAKHRYPDTWAYFSYGDDDPAYSPGIIAIAHRAEESGMTMRLDALPNAGHVVRALRGGLDGGFAWLYPRLHLDAPPA